MRCRTPDPDQGLFRWVYSDPADDLPDDPADDDLPPLRARVRRLHDPAPVKLWGVPVTLSPRPGPVLARGVMK